MSSESKSNCKPFQVLGKYTPPTTPTDETIRQAVGKFWRTLRRQEEDPFLTDGSLRVADSRKLNRIIPPPACGPLLSDMRETLDEWAYDPEPANWLQLVVLPPCDHNDVVGSWAKQGGHRIIPPPARADLIDASVDVELPEFADAQDRVLVIPRLEQWFLRHRNGLDTLRRLLGRLALLQRHCLVGCNSWGWSFMEKSLGADLILPHGLAPQPFDAPRLQDWFLELVRNGEAEEKIFRWSKNGQDIFATNGEANKLKSDFLATLAAKSLGIPWVAWHLWRGSLRYGPKDNARIKEKFPDEEALWVADLDEYSMPKKHTSTALLTLHALLIHHSLAAAELTQVLPSANETNVLHSLVSADLVQSDGDRYSCMPAAYPSIRQALANAGLPLDQL